MAKPEFDPKLILITGAGASAPLGMPTAAGFLDVLRKNESINQRYLDEAIVASQKLVAGTQMERVDVESLLDHLTSFCSGARSVLAETQITITVSEWQSIDERVKQYSDLREQILKSIVETYGEVDAEAVVPLLHALTYGLSKCFDVTVLPVFTLNYDMAFETYIDQMQPKVEIIDGFDRAPSALIRRWSKDNFARSLADPPTTETELRILLFKLHGSANWGRDSRTRKLHQIGFVPRDPGRYETVLYYPSLNQKPAYQEPFQTAFDHLLESVMRAETIVIIGTSFRDKPVNDILLRAKPYCHVVINNLSEEEPEFVVRLKDKGMNVTYVAGDIGRSSTRYAVVQAALRPPIGSQGKTWWRVHHSRLPMIESITYAGLHRAGKRPDAIVDGDIIAGPYPDYFLVSNGVRRHIPDIPTFDVLGFSYWDLIRSTDDAQELPLGDPLPSLIRDGVLIKRPNAEDVFIVLDGKLCHVDDQPSLEVLKRVHPRYGKYGVNNVRRDVSDDTFRSLSYGDPVQQSNFDHHDPEGNPLGATKAIQSILHCIASSPRSSIYDIQTKLGFSDERVLRGLLLNLVRLGAIASESPTWEVSKPSLAVNPVERIYNLPYAFTVTNNGTELLQSEIKAGSVSGGDV